MMNVDFNNLRDSLHRSPHFAALVSLCRQKNAYLAGGAVRDALSGLPVKDVDLVFPDDPTSLAKEFASQAGGHWFWLDEVRRQSRVVLNNDEECPDFDFAPFRAPTLGLDLLDRDFTINAMALPLAECWSGNVLIDPLCGLDDLRDGLLRMASDTAFSNDPLRILKGIRHATALDLIVEAKTLRSMQQQVTGLYRVAVERIRQEVWKMLACDNAPHGLDLLCESMVGNYLFGNSYSSVLAEMRESLLSVRGLLRTMAEQEPIVEKWLAEEIEQGLSSETLILWVSLMARLQVELPQKLAEEWMLSRKARRNIETLADIERLLLEFLYLGHGQRSFNLWARKHRVDPKLLLLSLFVHKNASSDVRSNVVKRVPIVAALGGKEIKPCVSGHWLCSEFGLQEGPQVRKALDLLADAEMFGEVFTEDDARSFLLEYYKNSD